MTDDAPKVGDPELQAMIDRAHKRIAERDPAAAEQLYGAGDAGHTVITGTESLTHDEVYETLTGDDIVAAPKPVTEGPTLETLVEKWGLTYEDARLLRGESPTTTFRETTAITCAREFLAEARGGQIKICVLTGTRGVGKTVAAGWMMVTARPDLGGKAWPTERHPVMIAASKIATWGSYGMYAEREQLARCRVLVIDELGIEDDTRGFGPYINELLNQRAGAAGYTAITCNLDPTEMAQRYGARVMDRLRARGAWFEIDHASLRTR